VPEYLVCAGIAAYFERVFHPILTDETLEPERKQLPRLIDDLTLVFCLVGNDFLPHIPGMKIQQNALSISLLAYVEIIRDLGGYLSDKGTVNLARFKTYATHLLALFGTVSPEALHEAQQQRPHFMEPKAPAMSEMRSLPPAERSKAFRKMVEIRVGEVLDRDIEQQKRNDDTHVGTEGWEDRYMKSHFPAEFSAVSGDLRALRRRVALEYLKGLCFVVAYYDHGCPSWGWFYPLHYAPPLSALAELEATAVDVCTRPLGWRLIQ